MFNVNDFHKLNDSVINNIKTKVKEEFDYLSQFSKKAAEQVREAREEWIESLEYSMKKDREIYGDKVPDERATWVQERILIASLIEEAEESFKVVLESRLKTTKLEFILSGIIKGFANNLYSALSGSKGLENKEWMEKLNKGKYEPDRNAD